MTIAELLEVAGVVDPMGPPVRIMDHGTSNSQNPRLKPGVLAQGVLAFSYLFESKVCVAVVETTSAIRALCFERFSGRAEDDPMSETDRVESNGRVSFVEKNTPFTSCQRVWFKLVPVAEALAGYKWKAPPRASGGSARLPKATLMRPDVLDAARARGEKRLADASASPTTFHERLVPRSDEDDDEEPRPPKTPNFDTVAVLRVEQPSKEELATYEKQVAEYERERKNRYLSPIQTPCTRLYLDTTHDHPWTDHLTVADFRLSADSQLDMLDLWAWVGDGQRTYCMLNEKQLLRCDYAYRVNCSQAVRSEILRQVALVAKPSKPLLAYKIIAGEGVLMRMRNGKEGRWHGWLSRSHSRQLRDELHGLDHVRFPEGALKKPQVGPTVEFEPGEAAALDQFLTLRMLADGPGSGE